MFQTSFQLHCRHKNFNSCCKEEHPKRQQIQMFFMHILTWTQIHQSPVWCNNTTYKKILEGVWYSDFELSEQAMMVLHESLNSWNQWINDWPLYQSLFWPLLWKLYQKVKFRLLRHNDLWHLGFQNGKKDENSDFMEIFSFSISNIFVELLVTHIKLYIFWKNSLSSTQKWKTKSF